MCIHIQVHTPIQENLKGMWQLKIHPDFCMDVHTRVNLHTHEHVLTQIHEKSWVDSHIYNRLVLGTPNRQLGPQLPHCYPKVNYRAFCKSEASGHNPHFCPPLSKGWGSLIFSPTDVFLSLLPTQPWSCSQDFAEPCPGW